MDIFKAIRSKKRLNILKWPEEPLGLSTPNGGGYHNPVLGQTLNQRYTIVRKLGWGRDSNVWLTRDSSQTRRQRFAAVKVLTSYTTQGQGTLVADERLVLRSITALVKTSTHPGRNHVLTLLDAFQFDDLHGPHLCLVHEAMGSFVATFQASGRKIPIHIVKHIARHLLRALDFLHRECRIVHTDIKPENLLLRTTTQRSTHTVHFNDHPDGGQLPPPSNVPASAILSRPIIPFRFSEKSAKMEFDVLLADFGSAVKLDNEEAGFHPETTTTTNTTIQPYALRAPEVIVGCPWDTSVDIWNLGCLLFEFITGESLFPPSPPPPNAAGIEATQSLDAHHLARMPMVTGEEFDVDFMRKGKWFERYFDVDSGALRQVRVGVDLETALLVTTTRDGVVIVENDDEMEERRACVGFLKAMVKLDPEKRVTAEKLLSEFEWVKGVI